MPNAVLTIAGLLIGGGWEQLGVQALGCLIVTVWAMVSTVIIFGALSLTIGVRMSAEHEVMGADWTEVHIGPHYYN